MKMGIIGAENSHAAAIAKIINVEKLIKGVTVDSVWGEKDEYARKTAEEGRIPNVVKRPADMLGKVDAIMVDHRHPKYHLKAAWPFAERGIPAFIDKPFCFRAAEGKTFLAMARKNGATITSFSVLPFYSGFAAFKKKLPGIGTVLSASSYGPCDLKSQWGGIFFYGIHQVDVMLHAFGYDVKAVLVAKNGPNATGQLFFKSGLVATMALIKDGCHDFGMSAVGEKGVLHVPLDSKKNPYLDGAKMFTTMFKTGIEPLSDEQMLKPVQVLEALEKSVVSGQIEKVEG